MIGENLKTAIAKSGLFVKEVAAKSGVKKRTIDKWVGAEETEPKVLDLYKVCVALRTTIEEIVGGEAGEQYLREYVREKAWQFSPPERIADIVEGLQELSDDELVPIRGAIKAILDKKEASGVPPKIKSGRTHPKTG
jgi:transcriptional regulator with XRE-family HTH domain